MKENMVYSIIKGGILSLTKQMSSHYGKFNIRVNAISPGGLYGHFKSTGTKQNKKFINNYKNRVPMKRLCFPNEVANAAIFLSSDAASYITGINLMVDGGWTAI